jgi:hypothetical protein
MQECEIIGFRYTDAWALIAAGICSLYALGPAADWKKINLAFRHRRRDLHGGFFVPP